MAKKWPTIAFSLFCPTETKIIVICEMELNLVPLNSHLKTVIIGNQEEQDG